MPNYRERPYHSVSGSYNQFGSKNGGRVDRMHLIILFVFLGLAAIIVWIADWATVPGRRATAVDILNRRLARGEIDRAEYDEKRRQLAR